MSDKKKEDLDDDLAYDVFLSHSSTDSVAVRELAEQLRADGLRIWFDEWEIRPGDYIGLKIERGLEESRILVLVMSAHAFASEWTTLESHTFRFRDPTNTQRRFIPLLLEDATIPTVLKPFSYVDWRHRSAQEYTRLLEACRPEGTAPQDSSRLVASITPLPIRSLEGHTDWVTKVAVTSDGLRAFSCSRDGTLRRWDIVSGASVLVTGTKVGCSMAVTADGRCLVYGENDCVWVQSDSHYSRKLELPLLSIPEVNCVG
jgi:hypothetical protein